MEYHHKIIIIDIKKEQLNVMTDHDLLIVVLEFYFIQWRYC